MSSTLLIHTRPHTHTPMCVCACVVMSFIVFHSVASILILYKYLQIHNSTDNIVVLKSVNLSSTGRYRCEVSAEAPSFETVSDHGIKKESIHIRMFCLLTKKKTFPQKFQVIWLLLVSFYCGTEYLSEGKKQTNTHEKKKIHIANPK